MAATKITITLDPAEYATLKRELTESRERHEGKRKSETDPRTRHEEGELVIRLDKLLKEI